jgi:hypothetical protein
MWSCSLYPRRSRRKTHGSPSCSPMVAIYGITGLQGNVHAHFRTKRAVLSCNQIFPFSVYDWPKKVWSR